MLKYAINARKLEIVIVSLRAQGNASMPASYLKSPCSTKCRVSNKRQSPIDVRSLIDAQTVRTHRPKAHPYT